MSNTESVKKGSAIDRIKAHSITKILVTIFVVGGSVAKITYELVKNRYEADISQRDFKIEQLQTNYASIKRTLSDGENSSLNLSSLAIKEYELRNLDNSYKAILDNRIFYKEPIGEAWSYKLIPGYEFSELTYNDQKNLDPLTKEAIKKQLSYYMHLWQGKEKYTVTLSSPFKLPGIGLKRLSYFPSITVQSFELKQDSPDVAIDKQINFFVAGSITKQIVYEGTSSKLVSMEKKNGMAYINTRVKHQGFEIDGSKVESELTIDREAFIYNSGKTIIIIQTTIPSIGGRSNAYSYVSQWLKNMRIVT